MSRLPTTLLTVVLLLGGTLAAAGDPMAEPIRYTLRFPEARHHYIEVEALLPTGGRPRVELMMAVWTPGSYLVREFARNLEGLRAETTDETALPLEKVRKNRWRIDTRGADPVRLRYRVYAREMSVRTDFVDASFALVNGAATFLTLAEGDEGRGPQRPHDVFLELPEGWSRAISALPEAPGGGESSFRAADFDTLVDSPIYAGNPEVYPLDVDGGPVWLVNEGEGGVWDGPRSAADAARIVREQIRFWGVRPFDRYVFFNILSETGGGLEHEGGAVLMTSRWKTRTHKGYLDWLGLVSHELFHAWNVKRLRPRALGPFDYEREVYTRSLWIAEGITSYYGDLLVHRAGLSSRKELLESLSKTIERLQTTPGRRVQPLELASFDSWIKQYRRDENFANSAVSYYTKGAVVAFLLDAEIRRATDGARSLDDLLRQAYHRWSGERGYTPEEIRNLASEVAGTDLAPWLHRALETTEELDYTPALAWLGLRFVPAKKEKPEPEEGAEPAAWLGAETEVRDGRLLVTEVDRGTPAFAAGLNVDDEILAIGDYRLPPAGLGERLEAYRPGEQVSLLVARRERLLRLPVTLGEEPARPWKLEADPEATAAQRAHLDAWLGAETPAPEPRRPATPAATAAAPR